MLPRLHLRTKPECADGAHASFRQPDVEVGPFLLDAPDDLLTPDLDVDRLSRVQVIGQRTAGCIAVDIGKHLIHALIIR